MSEVYKAISAVAADLCGVGIGKDGTNKAQGFKYRSIEAAVAALSPLLVKHGLLILPRLKMDGLKQVGRDGTNKQGDAKFTMHTTLELDYVFVSVKDGSEFVCSSPGEAADTGDKSVAKAMSMAYKYLVFQAFCVPIEGQDIDPDAETHEFQGTTRQQNRARGAAADTKVVNEAQRLELVDLLTKAKVDVKIFLEHYGASGLSAFPADQFADASSRLKQRVGEAEADAALAGNSTATEGGATESKPPATRTSPEADAGSAGSSAKQKDAKVGPKVSRFRGIRA